MGGYRSVEHPVRAPDPVRQQQVDPRILLMRVDARVEVEGAVLPDEVAGVALLDRDRVERDRLGRALVRGRAVERLRDRRVLRVMDREAAARAERPEIERDLP